MIALALISAVVLGGAAPPGVFGAPRRDSRIVVEDHAPSWTRAVGRLRVQSSDPSVGAPAGSSAWSTGTATLVGPDLVLTAWHVVAPHGRLQDGAWTLELGYDRGASLARRTGRSMRQAVVAFDAHADWALVRLEFRVSHIAPMAIGASAEGPFDPDTSLVLAGYSGDRTVGASGQVLTIDRGCTSPRALERHVAGPFRRTRCFSHAGASGGPLVAEASDDTARITGITTRIFERIPGWTFVAPADAFRQAALRAGAVPERASVPP